MKKTRKLIEQLYKEREEAYKKLLDIDIKIDEILNDLINAIECDELLENKGE